MTEDRVLEVESLRKDFDGGRGRVVRAVDDVSLSIERGEVVGLALSLRPSLLVADEPVSALDVAVQASILNLLRDLQGELGFACMFITHDLSTVEYLCDRVVVMYLGRVLEMGTRDRVFSQPTHPYTRSLLSAAPVPDPAVQRGRGRIALEASCPRPPTRPRAAASARAAHSRARPASAPSRGRRSCSTAAATGTWWLPPRGGRRRAAARGRLRHHGMTPTFTTRPELAGSFGMAASTHWMATATAMSILERGGNAFDAAVAGGFVLQVVEPHLNGPGGDLPVVLWSAVRGEPFVICGQGVAPAAASIPLLRDELGLDLVPGTGLLPACVPGAFDGWMLLLRDFGTMRLGEVLEHAIALAGRGFPVVERITTTVEDVADLFADEWTTSAEVWLPGGRPPAPRTMFRTPATAATYARIVREAEAATGDRDGQIEHARDAWLRGWVAEEIVAWTSSHEVLDASGRRHAGLLTGDDLANWSATIEAPVRGGYAGLEICKTGPWGQGPMLLQTLRLLEGYDLQAMGRGAEHVHTVVEALKLAFADREAFYGDADPGAIPLDALLSPEYAAQRRALIGDRASAELRPGSPGGIPGRMPIGGAETAATTGAGEPTLGDTCHLDVVDRFGNLVACTPSGGWLQSSPVIPALGFPLGTRGQMFWLEEGLPSSLLGGRRPRTTLSPSLALRDGEGAIAFGTPGGDQQDQWSLQLLLNHLNFGMNLQEAIDAPAFRSGHFPSSFWPRGVAERVVEVEGRWNDEVVDDLRGRGHEVVVGEPWSLGRLSAVSREPDGTLRAAANPRGMQGYAAGR